MMKKKGWWTVCRWFGAGLVGGLLTACAGLENMVDRGLEPMLVQLAPDSEAYRFDFVFDDSADDDDQVYGAGFVVVSQGGKELQAIQHAFELPRDNIDGRQWLKFWDANGDGWQDFAVVRLLAPESQMPVSVLYQYEPQTRTFVAVEPLSHLGELMPAGRGCLQLRFAVEAGHTAQETHCYSAQAARWVRQLGPGTGGGGGAPPPPPPGPAPPRRRGGPGPRGGGGRAPGRSGRPGPHPRVAGLPQVEAGSGQGNAGCGARIPQCPAPAVATKPESRLRAGLFAQPGHLARDLAALPQRTLRLVRARAGPACGFVQLGHRGLSLRPVALADPAIQGAVGAAVESERVSGPCARPG